MTFFRHVLFTDSPISELGDPKYNVNKTHFHSYRSILPYESTRLTDVISSKILHNVQEQALRPIRDFHRGNFFLLKKTKNGGAGRDRTDDILLAKQALSQLSYSPTLENWWAW